MYPGGGVQGGVPGPGSPPCCTLGSPALLYTAPVLPARQRRTRHRQERHLWALVRSWAWVSLPEQQLCPELSPFLGELTGLLRAREERKRVLIG